MARLVVSGGRFFFPVPSEVAAFEAIVADVFEGEPFEPVHGACPTGADAWFHGWCLAQGLTPTRFPADWKARGKAGGPIRNKSMAQYASKKPGSALVWFPGNAGTLNMRREATSAGLLLRQVSTTETGDLARLIEQVISGRPIEDIAPDAAKARRQVGRRYGDLKSHFDFMTSAATARLEWLEGVLTPAPAGVEG